MLFLRIWEATYLETLAPSEYQVTYRNADVVVDDFTMALGGIVVSEHLHWADDLDTRRVGRNKDDTLLFVGIGVGSVTLSHEDVDLAAGITSSTDPPRED